MGRRVLAGRQGGTSTLRNLTSSVLFVVLGAGLVAAQSTVPDGEWHAFGRDAANSKYSPLDELTAENFTDLQIAWRWTSISQPVAAERETIRPGPFIATPLMADGLVYIITALGQVAALDAGTGEAVWTYDPRIYDDIERPPNMGWRHRGLSYWNDDESDDARIFLSNHDLKLVALNARTGARYSDFGENGYIDLTKGYDREIDASRMTYSSPVAVAGDTIITGSIIQDTNIRQREASPGDVRAYDARTGGMKWIFHTIPQGDEFGVDSWQNESWRYSGHSNVWSYMAVDEELGLVYLPTGTPSNDWYGGMRPGDNLFAESIIAVDIETGQRVWHFQAIHHGLWDWDFPTGPNLLDIEVDGREMKAIAQVSKQAFTYVLDRATGEPVWPIEERRVPQGNVPGEWYSPTQPFPTKPPPFDRREPLWRVPPCSWPGQLGTHGDPGKSARRGTHRVLPPCDIEDRDVAGRDRRRRHRGLSAGQCPRERRRSRRGHAARTGPGGPDTRVRRAGNQTGWHHGRGTPCGSCERLPPRRGSRTIAVSLPISSRSSSIFQRGSRFSSDGSTTDR